ncbi:hypothetical protein [Pedobacter sp. NJ-S-72]
MNPAGTPISVGCEGPISQTNGVGGLLSILSRVDNPLLAIDNDQVTASTLSIYSYRYRFKCISAS